MIQLDKRTIDEAEIISNDGDASEYEERESSDSDESMDLDEGEVSDTPLPAKSRKLNKSKKHANYKKRGMFS